MNIHRQVYSKDPNELWDALKEGDKSAFREIYELYIDDLYRFGKSLCGDEAMLADAIQDVFFDLWQYRSSLSNPEHCKYYLLRSFSNRIKRDLGKQKKIKEMEGVYALEGSSLGKNVEDRMVEDQLIFENKQVLTKAFQALSVRQREVLHLLFFEGMSYSEVSDQLKINLKSTYTLTWKALKKLRKSLGENTLFILLYMFLVD